MSETERGSGNGTSYGYRIEVRTTMSGGTPQPRTVGGFIVTGDWRELPTVEGERGIPNNQWNVVARQQQLLTYEAALGIAAHFQASAGLSPCLEFRLVKLKLVHSYSVTEEGVGEPLSFWDQERAAAFSPRVSPAPDAGGSDAW